MTSNIAYKDYFMRGESFQREKRGAWVAQYTIVRQESNGKDFPSHQYQFSHVFRTETEANDFAVKKAGEWIDQNQGSRGCIPRSTSNNREFKKLPIAKERRIDETL